MPKPDLSTWLPKSEVMQRLRMADRTVDRHVERGDLAVQYRPIPGRRPLPVYDPSSVEKLAEAQMQARTVVLPPESRSVARVAESRVALPGKPEKTSAVPAVPLHLKVFLTFPEAAAYSGLTEGYLRRLIQQGVLPAITEGMQAHRVKRADLEKLEVAAIPSGDGM